MGIDVEAVIRRVLGGEIEAYSEIVRVYQQSVWRIVAYALRDRRTTEDMVQQVFISAYQRLDAYEPGRDFGKWLNGIARNMVCHEIRDRTRETKRFKVYEDGILRSVESEGAEERMTAMADALACCRQALGGPAREALRLRYDLGLECSEVASRLGRTLSATLMFLSRIRASLGECVQKRMAIL